MMSTDKKQQRGEGDFSGFDDDFSKPKQLTVVPDGQHALQIKGLRRHFTGAGDCWVTVDVSVIASKGGYGAREFMGKEFEIGFFLQVDKTDNNGRFIDNKKVRQMNIDRCKAFLATAAGQEMPGSFSRDFEQWQKMVQSLCIVVTQKTSEPNEQGKQYVNYYADKAYTMTDDDRKLLGASVPGAPAVIPF